MGGCTCLSCSKGSLGKWLQKLHSRIGAFGVVQLAQRKAEDKRQPRSKCLLPRLSIQCSFIPLDCKNRAGAQWGHLACTSIKSGPMSLSFCGLLRPSPQNLHSCWAVHRRQIRTCFKNAAESIKDAGWNCICRGGWGLLLHILQWLHCKAHPQSCAGQEPPATAALQTPWAAACFPAGVGSLLGKCSLLRGFYSSKGYFCHFPLSWWKHNLWESEPAWAVRDLPLSGGSVWVGAAMVECLRVCLSWP